MIVRSPATRRRTCRGGFEGCTALTCLSNRHASRGTASAATTSAPDTTGGGEGGITIDFRATYTRLGGALQRRILCQSGTERELRQGGPSSESHKVSRCLSLWHQARPSRNTPSWGPRGSSWQRVSCFLPASLPPPTSRAGSDRKLTACSLSPRR